MVCAHADIIIIYSVGMRIICGTRMIVSRYFLCIIFLQLLLLFLKIPDTQEYFFNVKTVFLLSLYIISYLSHSLISSVSSLL